MSNKYFVKSIIGNYQTKDSLLTKFYLHLFWRRRRFIYRHCDKKKVWFDINLSLTNWEIYEAIFLHIWYFWNKYFSENIKYAYASYFYVVSMLYNNSGCEDGTIIRWTVHSLAATSIDDSSFLDNHSDDSSFHDNHSDDSSFLDNQFFRWFFIPWQLSRWFFILWQPSRWFFISWQPFRWFFIPWQPSWWFFVLHFTNLPKDNFTFIK